MEEEKYRPGHYMDFSWQMCYANKYLDLNWFLKCKGYHEVELLTKEYLKYKDDPMNPYILNYWAELGIRKDYYPCDINTVNSRRESHHYSVLGPVEWKKKTYPVIYFCHGGGQDAFEAECYGLAERIPEDEFFYVSPNQYGVEEFERILNEMTEKRYPIDKSRIYVFGFSGGSGSAAEIALKCPQKVAGVTFIPGPNAFNQMTIDNGKEVFTENSELRIPLICIGGNCDGGDCWPLVDDISYSNLNFWMQNVCKVSEYHSIERDEAEMLIADSSSKVQQSFGLKFHKEYINEMDDTFCYVGDYLLEDGIAIARFCSVAGMPHGAFPMYTGVAWSFLKKFSRNTETGKLEYQAQNMDFRTRRGGK